MRNMSHSITVQQAREMTKTVTRRNGWWNVSPGERIQQVVKGMGLKRGEKIEKIHVVEVHSARGEKLSTLLDHPKYAKSELIKEGFPNLTPVQFVDMFCASHKGVTPESYINRIEYRYVLRTTDTDSIRVPASIATCVSCKTKLTISPDGWEENPITSKWVLNSFSINCESELALHEDDPASLEAYNDSHEEAFRMPYIYWLPVQEKILNWADRTIIFEDLEGLKNSQNGDYSK